MFDKLSNFPAVIEIVLGAFLLLGLVIALERFLFLHRSRVDTLELFRGLTTQLRTGHVKEAVTNCDVKTGPVGEIFRAAIERWNDGDAAILHAVEEMGQILIPRLERNMKLLATIANLTPIIGLLGTLCALISAFGKISGEFQGAEVLSGDIKVALVCTALGLLVSMVCQLSHAILVEKVDHVLEEMSKAASEITYFLSKNPPPAESAPAATTPKK